VSFESGAYGLCDVGSTFGSTVHDDWRRSRVNRRVGRGQKRRALTFGPKLGEKLVESVGVLEINLRARTTRR
jgi:hypothetical protein